MKSNLSKGVKAHPQKIFTRSLGLFLSLVLTLPIPPAFALRQTGLEEQEVNGRSVNYKEELIAALTSAGLEEGKVRKFLKSAALVTGGVVAGAAGVATYNQLAAPEAQPPAQVAPGATENVLPQFDIETREHTLLPPLSQAIVSADGIRIAFPADVAGEGIWAEAQILSSPYDQFVSRIPGMIPKSESRNPVGVWFLGKRGFTEQMLGIPEWAGTNIALIEVVDRRDGWDKDKTLLQLLIGKPNERGIAKVTILQDFRPLSLELEVVEGTLSAKIEGDAISITLPKDLAGHSITFEKMKFRNDEAHSAWYKYWRIVTDRFHGRIPADGRKTWTIPDELLKQGYTAADMYPQRLLVYEKLANEELEMRVGSNKIILEVELSEPNPNGQIPIKIIQSDLPRTQSDAGLEELQSVFNQLLEKDSAMQQVLEDKGWISLQPGQVGTFGYQAIGGFIVADSAKLTDASHAVIADEDLGNELAERVLAWIRAGKAAPDVVKNARLMNARRGDLLVFEEEAGLTADQIKQLLAENGIEGAEAARAVMGDRFQVRALPVFAFQLFASEDGLPPVIVLSVAVQLQDKAGNTYALVLMA